MRANTNEIDGWPAQVKWSEVLFACSPPLSRPPRARPRVARAAVAQSLPLALVRERARCLSLSYAPTKHKLLCVSECRIYKNIWAAQSYRLVWARMTGSFSCRLGLTDAPNLSIAFSRSAYLVVLLAEKEPPRRTCKAHSRSNQKMT